MNKQIAIKVFQNKGNGYEEKDAFYFSVPPYLVALPEAEPYRGHKFLFSTDGADGFEFAPEEPNVFVRFNPNHPAQIQTYFGYERYLLLFLAQGGEGEKEFQLRVKKQGPVTE